MSVNQWEGPIPCGDEHGFWLMYQHEDTAMRFRILESAWEWFPADAKDHTPGTGTRCWFAPTSTGSNDTTEELPQTDEEAFGHGFVKWDVCFQMFFHPEANLHMDSEPLALAMLQETILHLARRIPLLDASMAEEFPIVALSGLDTFLRWCSTEEP